MRAPLEEEEKSALEEVLEFLKDELQDGPMAAKQVKPDAKKEYPREHSTGQRPASRSGPPRKLTAGHGRCGRTQKKMNRLTISPFRDLQKRILDDEAFDLLPML